MWFSQLCQFWCSAGFLPAWTPRENRERPESEIFLNLRKKHNIWWTPCRSYLVSDSFNEVASMNIYFSLFYQHVFSSSPKSYHCSSTEKLSWIQEDSKWLKLPSRISGTLVSYISLFFSLFKEETCLQSKYDLLTRTYLFLHLDTCFQSVGVKYLQDIEVRVRDAAGILSIYLLWC